MNSESLPRFSQEIYWPVSAARMLERERLDAEHFQPRYEELLDYLRSSGESAELGEIATVIRRGRQPRYVDGGSVLVFNSRHVGKQFLNSGEAERTDLQFWKDTPVARCQLGDVLLNSTGVGSIGRANCVFEDTKAVVDNHVTIIRVPSEVCDPAYLAIFLSSQLGMMQTEQWLSGSSGQIELYPASISRFTVHLPDPEIQKSLGRRVSEADQVRREALAIVDSTRKEVEALDF